MNIVSHARETDLTTHDGLKVYDLDPQAAELVAVAGRGGVYAELIDPDHLPEGFRWVEPAEWEALQCK